MSRDAVVIGAGADELVVAELLAKDGYRVTVLEEFASRGLETGWTPLPVLRAVGLGPGGGMPDAWGSVRLPDGGWLQLSTDMARSVEAIRRVNPRDAERWPSFCARVRRVAALLEDLYLQPPSAPLDLRFALKVRALGREGMEDLMRLLPMPVAELLEEWFENDALKGLLAAGALRHLQQGPRSAGTAFAFLHHHAGAPAGVFRQPQSRLRRTLRERAASQVRAARVAAIEVKAGAVSAVVLDSGEALAARLVVSGAGPRRTLLELVDAAWLDPDLARAVSHVRARGVAIRVTAAAPAFPGVRVLAPSLDFLERAYDAAKYGRASAEPWAEARSDGEVAEAHVQYVPFDAPAPAVDGVLGALGMESPAAKVESGPELLREQGWPEGQPFQAELALDQALWLRPRPELARYRTPVDGLWLCGPGTHPGAGVVGASGYNCAREIARHGSIAE